MFSPAARRMFARAWSSNLCAPVEPATRQALARYDAGRRPLTDLDVDFYLALRQRVMQGAATNLDVIIIDVLVPFAIARPVRDVRLAGEIIEQVGDHHHDVPFVVP